MSKAEPRPSTRNARARNQIEDGTGQHTQRIVDPSPGVRPTRTNDSPTSTSSLARTAQDRDAKSRTAQSQTTAMSQRTTTAPDVSMPPFQLVRDSGPKTAREREFNKMIGTSGGKQFETVYEMQKAKVADADKNTGAEVGYRSKKAQ